MRKILLLFAHPSPERSEVNVPLFQAALTIDNVTGVDLYREYPTFRIDVDREQKRLGEHDVVIFLFPLYWYSTPALLKEWQDLVLEYGFAYGSSGKALHGKIFFCATSAGGPESAYCEEGHNHYTIREIMQPFEQLAFNSGMRYLAPFALFGARTAVEEDRLNEHIENWKKILIGLRDDTINLVLAGELPKLNFDMDLLLGMRK